MLTHITKPASILTIYADLGSYLYVGATTQITELYSIVDIHCRYDVGYDVGPYYISRASGKSAAS